jgi:uncharacterized protein involved in cysteine biosynthesis
LFAGIWGLIELWSLVPEAGQFIVNFVAPAATGVWATTIYILTLILIWPASLFFLLYGLFVVNKVIAAPFLALLAEYHLIEAGVLADRPFHLRHWLAVGAKMFFVSLIKSIVFTILGVFLFFVSFIPVLNVVAVSGALLIVAFDLSDYAFEALQMGFRERIRFFLANLSTFSGIATAMGLVFFVPGLNVFSFPACVAGATDVVRRILREQAR